MDWAKTTARGYKKHLVMGFGAAYTRGFTVLLFCHHSQSDDYDLVMVLRDPSILMGIDGSHWCHDVSLGKVNVSNLGEDETLCSITFGYIMALNIVKEYLQNESLSQWQFSNHQMHLMVSIQHIKWLVQEIRNSSALAIELHLSCTDLLI